MNEPVQATYTIQLRAVLSGATGDAKSVSWSFLRCSPSQYAVVNDTDGAIECAACTWRHSDRSLMDVAGCMHMPPPVISPCAQSLTSLTGYVCTS